MDREKLKKVLLEVFEERFDYFNTWQFDGRTKGGIKHSHFDFDRLVDDIIERMKA